MAIGGGQDTNFKIPAMGTYNARLVWMIDYGTQEKFFQGKASGTAHKGQWWFELVDTNEDFGKGVMEPFFVKTKELTYNLQGSSNTLRDYLGILMQRPIVKSEVIELKQFIGMPVMLGIVHAKSADGSKTYANISSIIMPTAGQQIAPLRNRPIFFEIGAPDMFTEFVEIKNKYVQGTIVKSPEFQKFSAQVGFDYRQYVIAENKPAATQPTQQFQQPQPQFGQPQQQFQQPQQFQQQPTAPVQPQFANPVQTSAPQQPWVPPTPQWGQQAQQFVNPQQPAQQFQQPTVPQPQFGQPQQQFQQPQAPQQPAVPATPQWNQPQQPQAPQFQQPTQSQQVPNPNYNPNVAGSPQFIPANQPPTGDPF